MRLAVFTSTYPARVATFFERDMRGLIEAGVTLDVFVVAPLNPSLWRYRTDILPEHVLPHSRLHYLGIPQSLREARPWPPRRVARFLRDTAAVSISALRFGPVPFVKSAYVFPKAWAWAAEHADRYDHVLAYWGNYTATCAYLFHRLIDRPIPFSIWLHAGADLYRTQVYLRQKLLYADNIITCCEYNRRFLRERYADVAQELDDKTHVCYHGLDLSTFHYRPEGRPPRTVIGVGRLDQQKGFDHLVRATHELHRRGVPVELELVGDGPERDTLRGLVKSLGLAEHVRFHGLLPFNEVRAVMSRATVLVHPSDGVGDGLPNVLREAMAVGTPVVASRWAGIPEALDDGRCGVLVPPGDTRGLADAVQCVLSDEGLRRTYAERARRRTEELFDLWRNGSRLAEHLRGTRARAEAASPC